MGGDKRKMSETNLLTDILGDENSPLRIKWTTRYLELYGMFESRNGSEYSTFDNINTDLFTWKQYEMKLDQNSQNIQEIKLDLSDVTLLGSQSTMNSIVESVPRF